MARTDPADFDELPIERVPIGRLKLDPKNARRHPRRNLDLIRASLQAFGLRKPLVVSKRYVVAAGNGTLEVIQEMNADTDTQTRKFPEIPVTVFPGTVAEARAYAIADNRSGDLAEWEEAVLAEQLGGFNAALLEAAGFDQVEVDDLMAAVAKAERGGSQYGDPEFPGQQPKLGAAAKADRYEGKATRTLFFEFSNDLFVWIVESLNAYRGARELPSNADAIVAMIAEVSGTQPPVGAAEGDGIAEAEVEPEEQAAP